MEHLCVPRDSLKHPSHIFAFLKNSPNKTASSFNDILCFLFASTKNLKIHKMLEKAQKSLI